MAPKPKGAPLSPKIGNSPGRSPLAGAGATMLGKAPSKEAPAAAGSGMAIGGTNGKAPAAIGGNDTKPTVQPKMPGSTSARSNTSANAIVEKGAAKASPPATGRTSPYQAEQPGKAEPKSEPAKANGEAAKVKPATPPVAKESSSKAPAAAASGAVEPEVVMKFASAIRWGKPWEEIEAAAGEAGVKAVSAEKDPKNGNFAIHIAAQNGHMEIVEKLIKAGGPVNCRNGKGQTALHMAVEYDFYFLCRLLIDNGADIEIANDEGHKAILGIDGGKTGFEAWDNPVTILRAANTKEELDIAFKALEEALATPETVSKEKLISCGLGKKKSPITQGVWDHKLFMSLAAKF